MKRFKYIGIMMMAAGMLTATSCSDFDDYNEAQMNPEATGNLSLWENIKQNPNLSDFKELVEKAGFDDELQGSHYYTVWAPLNGTFDKSQFENLDEAALLKQFVYNHIADYNHPISGDVTNRIYTLNRKTYNFTGLGGVITYADVKLDQANLPSTNGIIHTLHGAAMFYDNIYDFITGSQEYTKLSEYFNKYELSMLDEENSVKGPMVNGLQTYVDSVMIVENSLLDMFHLDADLQHEDSSYTFIVPTDKAWESAYNRIKPYYNYIKNTTVQDLTATQSSSKIPTINTGDIDNAMLSDSITKRFIVNDLVYSNNNWYNQWIVTGREATATDSIRSTTRTKLSNPGDILGQTIGEPLKMSNGWVRLVDSLAFYSWETFAPERRINPLGYAGLITAAGSARNINIQFTKDAWVNKWGDFTEQGGEFRFSNIEPSGARTKPELHVFLPGVLSTKYKFYVVFVPGAIIGEDNRPNQVNFTLNYCKADGKLAKYNFSSDLLHNNPSKQVPFVNDTSKVDTMFIGEFTFPVAYAGLPQNGNKMMAPDIKISSPMSVFNATLLNTYTRALRIAAIIMKPVELAEFEENQK